MGSTFCLGLEGGKPQHHTTKLRLADYRTGVAYPAAIDVTIDQPADLDDLGNIGNGDCGLAGPGHNILWMDSVAGRDRRVTTEGVLAAWNAINGGTGEGVTSDQVLAYWRTEGICGCRLAASLVVDYNDHEAMTAACFELGGVHLMFSLPKCVQGEMEWVMPAGDDGGTWGGHWVWAFASSTSDGIMVNSWGQWIYVSWAFVARYAFDARAVISEDDIGPNGLAFSGLDMEGLRAAIAGLSA